MTRLPRPAPRWKKLREKRQKRQEKRDRQAAPKPAAKAKPARSTTTGAGTTNKSPQTPEQRLAALRHERIKDFKLFERNLAESLGLKNPVSLYHFLGYGVRYNVDEVIQAANRDGIAGVLVEYDQAITAVIAKCINARDMIRFRLKAVQGRMQDDDEILARQFAKRGR